MGDRQRLSLRDRIGPPPQHVAVERADLEHFTVAITRPQLAASHGDALAVGCRGDGEPFGHHLRLTALEGYLDDLPAGRGGGTREQEAAALAAVGEAPDTFPRTRGPEIHVELTHGSAGRDLDLDQSALRQGDRTIGSQRRRCLGRR